MCQIVCPSVRWLVLLALLAVGLLGTACGSSPAQPTSSPQAHAGSPSPSPTTASAGQIEPVPILMYHYIRPDSGKADPIGEDLSVSPEHFAAQMDYLAKHHFTPLTLAELADVRAKRLALPVNPIVLTFDDGYRDFYTQAWPVLHQHGFKATAFIVTGFVGQPHSVSWSMIEELHRSGLIEFGAHTVTHKELPSLATAKAQQEIVGSKRTLEAHLGQPVRTFAYPSGRFSQREVALLRQAGFEIAVTTRGGFARANQDSLLLPRLRIHATTRLAQFAANLE